MSHMPTTINQTKREMLKHKDNWAIPYFDFVDDFRRCRGDVTTLLPRPVTLNHPRFDALLASTVEALCAELRVKAPDWIMDVPGLKDPWFVTGIENLKAIAIVESPVFFRRRKIFTLQNFLSRA